MKKLSFLLILTNFIPLMSQKPSALDIAQQMHELAPNCQDLSLEEMNKVRRIFLEKNKEATIEDLVNAINTVIDGKDIITYFQSFGSNSVCQEHIKKLQDDKRIGTNAISLWQGSTTIEYLLDNGLIS